MSGWIARGRPSAEVVRVCALVVNGELNPEQGVHLLCAATYQEERSSIATRYFFLGLLISGAIFAPLLMALKR